MEGHPTAKTSGCAPAPLNARPVRSESSWLQQGSSRIFGITNCNQVLLLPSCIQEGVTFSAENDADAAALGEARWGAGQGRVRFLLVTIGTGIGGGAVIDGQLYRGVKGIHPEVGHHVTDPAGPLCFCGARGCWESLASGPAMSAWMKANTTGKGEPPIVLTAREICAMAEGGNGLAQRALAREAQYLGMGVANLTTLFCPDTIARGGGVMRSGHLFLDTIRRVMRESCVSCRLKKPRSHWRNWETIPGWPAPRAHGCIASEKRRLDNEVGFLFA